MSRPPDVSLPTPATAFPIQTPALSTPPSHASVPAAPTATPPPFALFPDNSGIRIGAWSISLSRGPIASAAVEEAFRVRAAARRRGGSGGGAAEGLEAREVGAGKVGREREAEEEENVFVKMPGMLFAENGMRCEWEGGRGVVELHTEGAFEGIGGGEKGEEWKVRAAKVWEERVRGGEVKVVQSLTDWTFTTEYTGTLKNELTGESILCEDLREGGERTAVGRVDYDQLRRVDIPILFFGEVVLFEDELDDHGTASYVVRIRVMPSFFFILARFYLRIDGVLVRTYDTRYYHAFGTEWVAREVCHKEEEVPVLEKIVKEQRVIRDKERVQAFLRTVKETKSVVWLNRTERN